MRFHRSQWPRDLKRTSAAARYLGLQVRNPHWAWMSVTCDRCLFLRRADHSSRVWCVRMNVTTKLRLWGGPWPTLVCLRREKTLEWQYIAPLTVISTDSPSPLMIHANYFSYCTSAPLIIFLQTKFVFLLEVNLPSFYGMFIIQSKSESHQPELKLINIIRQHKFLRWRKLNYQYEHNLTSTFTSAQNLKIIQELSPYVWIILNSTNHIEQIYSSEAIDISNGQEIPITFCSLPCSKQLATLFCTEITNDGTVWLITTTSKFFPFRIQVIVHRHKFL